MKLVTMFQRVFSISLVLTFVLLFIGSPRPVEAQNSLGSDSNDRGLTTTVVPTTVDPVKHNFDSRVRVQQGDTPSAGIYFNQNSEDVDHSFVGVAGPASVGFYGLAGAGWGFVMDTSTGNVGVGTQAPGYKLDVDGRIRIRQGSNPVSAGIWLYQNKPQADRAFIGMSDDTNVGFWGNTGANWGLLMNTSTGEVTISGKTTTKVLQIMGGADLAETFAIAGTEPIVPGQIVSIDADRSGALRIADTAYDRTVAGVISGAGGINPGLTLQQEGSVAEGAYPVSLTGRVYVWADAVYGSIVPGDLLTTSDSPGHAMKVTDHERAQGAILGKAMSSLEQGKGLVLVLVSLQ